VEKIGDQLKMLHPNWHSPHSTVLSIAVLNMELISVNTALKTGGTSILNKKG
jgi:hypothetical protein